MTKKYYEAVARMLSRIQASDLQDKQVVLGTVMDSLAIIFADENPNFNIANFRAACEGVK